MIEAIRAGKKTQTRRLVNAGKDKKGGCRYGKVGNVLYVPRADLRLRITAIGRERLHEITWDDAIKEGIADPGRGRGHSAIDRVHPITGCVAQFRRLWESIHGEGSWVANPEVWVISFEVLE
jgi:hypothetical protein